MDKDKIAKTLFVIACSHRKCPTTEIQDKWSDILSNAYIHRFSKFSEFTGKRKELTAYLATLPIEKANLIYSKKYPNREPREVFETNKGLYSSGVCRAVYRYEGNLYQQLSPQVKQALAEGTLNNVLIISALHGPTHPSDYLPYYDLTMDDKWKTNKLGKMWPGWIKNLSGKDLQQFLIAFEGLTVMVGDDYRTSALAIKNIMPNCHYVNFEKHCWSASNTQWGKKLNSWLIELLENPRQRSATANKPI